MNNENEITVEVDTSLEDLIKILKSKGFKQREEFDYNDIYLINKNDREDDYLLMLNKCIIIRNIIEKKKDTKFLVYKHKAYNDNKEIIKQGQIKVKIDDIDNSIPFKNNDFFVKKAEIELKETSER